MACEHCTVTLDQEIWSSIASSADQIRAALGSCGKVDKVWARVAAEHLHEMTRAIEDRNPTFTLDLHDWYAISAMAETIHDALGTSGKVDDKASARDEAKELYELTRAIDAPYRPFDAPYRE